jgi:hypothetical protein
MQVIPCLVEELLDSQEGPFFAEVIIYQTLPSASACACIYHVTIQLYVFVLGQNKDTAHCSTFKICVLDFNI